jgi:hypothetical protein
VGVKQQKSQAEMAFMSPGEVKPEPGLGVRTTPAGNISGIAN